jgi:GH15 family glucan-1,4-alpha-glucosidase
MFQKFVVPAANFMARFIDLDTGLPHASYDLWEEKFLTHTYTVALTYRALLVAVSLAKRFGEDQNSDEWENAARKMQQNSKILFNEDSKSYRKGILLDASGGITFDNTVDVSSMYGPMMFEFGLDKALTAQTAHAVESKLKDSCPEGGVPRYEHDNYFATQPQYEGNPWFVTSLWLAQYYIRTGRLEDARQQIDWALEHRSSTETLPEQIGASGGARVGVEPLVWSHAELVNTLLDYYG